MNENKIYYDNTNVSKLWNLAKNKIFDYRMVKDILKNVNKNDPYHIYFKSERSYKKFKELEFSSLAMY